MKAKKIPYYLLLISLTVGASLILGFLSFSGIFAVWPIVPLAFLAFGLSVGYEGEIYLQNIKGALNKLFFKRDYIKRQLAKEYLLENCPDYEKVDDCPQFFKDYKNQLKLLHKFNHKSLDEENKKRKRLIEKTLSDMEKWFTDQLFSLEEADPEDDYQTELRAWLQRQKTLSSINKKIKSPEQLHALLEQRRKIFNGVKLFSLISGLFMGLGSTYLLVGAFSSIPLIVALPFVFWPVFIIPMAVIAGSAWGLLTYNAITDIISNDTMAKWAKRITEDFRKGFNFSNVTIACIAIALVVLAVGLTICTAGTWWTVAKQARPLFGWMSKMPNLIMGAINPIFTGLSALAFNLQNTSETLEMVEEELKEEKWFIRRKYDALMKDFGLLLEEENVLQILNPVRLLINLVFTPLRIVLFLGHLGSVAATADQVPGVPKILSASLGGGTEGFEDLHYFMSHEHTSHDFHSLLKERLEETGGHDHSTDLPTQFLKLIFSPAHALAALWDSWASQLNNNKEKYPTQKVISFDKAYKKQKGEPADAKISLTLLESHKPCHAWRVEQAIHRIEKFEEKHLSNSLIKCDIANDRALLTTLKEEIKTLPEEELANHIIMTSKNKTYSHYRLFPVGKAPTQEFLEKLSRHIGAPAA